MAGQQAGSIPIMTDMTVSLFDDLAVTRGGHT
jgi:hypothetical protein